MNIEDCRRFYADEIRFAANVHSSALVEAFARVPRENFLGPGPWEIASPDLKALASLTKTQLSYTSVQDPRQLYHNVLIVLDKTGDLNNGQPSALARWIESLDLKPGVRVYHLGCGVGYYTAIMAEIVGPGGTVAASEVHPELAARAKQNLSCYPNVNVFAGDGATFDPGPCDAIFINAGVTHPLPLWLDRLSGGGSLILPLTAASTPTVGVGMMARITRLGGAYSIQALTPVGIYSCTGARDPEREPQLKAALMGGGFMKMKSLRRDVHEKSDSCVIHGADICLSTVEPGC